jgi:hypothetical protein
MMKRIQRVSEILAIVFILASVWFYMTPPPVRTLSIANDVFDLGEMPIGTTKEAVFLVRNGGDKPRKLFNLAPTCTLDCCFGPKLEIHVTIPANEEVDYVVEVKANRLGPFEVQTEIFLEDNGLRSVPITIRGQGVAAPKP